jgi:hypothetical protein
MHSWVSKLGMLGVSNACSWTVIPKLAQDFNPSSRTLRAMLAATSNRSILIHGVRE